MSTPTALERGLQVVAPMLPNVSLRVHERTGRLSAFFP